MFQQTNDGIVFCIKVIPKAFKSEAIGWEGELLKIRLAAVPAKGEANSELIRFLADFFAIAKSRIKLVKGETSRHKKICISDTPLSLIQQKLDTMKLN